MQSIPASTARVLLLAFALSASAAPLAFSQNYDLSQNGKSVGKAFLVLKKAGSGFSSTSGAKIDMPGLKYNFSEKESLDGNYLLTTSHLEGSVNGNSASVDTEPQGQQYILKITASGKASSNPLPFHPQAALMPDFDPAGLQVVLDLGAAHNNRDIWAIIPKQTGSISALRIATDRDEDGTLAGKPVVVHHFTVTADTARTEIFSSPDNELLQAEWPQQGFAMVREKFILTPSKRPGAPPPAAPSAKPAALASPAAPAPPQQ